MIFLVCILSGCTIIFKEIGQASYHAAYPHVKDLEKGDDKLENIKLNSYYLFKLQDGTKVEGKVVKIWKKSYNEYSKKFNHARMQFSETIPLPSLFDTLMIQNQSSKRSIFMGFDFDGILLKPIKVQKLQTLTISKNDVQLQDNGINNYSMKDIYKLYDLGKIPF